MSKRKEADRPRLDLTHGHIEFVPDDGPRPKKGYVWVGNDKTYSFTGPPNETRKIVRFCKQVLEFHGYKVTKKDGFPS